MKDFELVVPAYNEERNIPNLVNRAIQAAQQWGYNSDQFSFILVQNGSTDNSQTVIDQLMRNEQIRPWLKSVLVTVNQGYGFGVWSGLKNTEAKYIAWSHADLQCDPNDAFKALDILKKSSNPKTLVKGTRIGRNWKDKIVSRAFEICSYFILGSKIIELNAQPKVFSRELLNELKIPPFSFAFDIYVLYHAQKGKYDIKTVEVYFPPRIHGVSKWASNFLSRYKTILNMIRYMFELRKSEGKI